MNQKALPYRGPPPRGPPPRGPGAPNRGPGGVLVVRPLALSSLLFIWVFWYDCVLGTFMNHPPRRSGESMLGKGITHPLQQKLGPVWGIHPLLTSSATFWAVGSQEIPGSLVPDTLSVTRHEISQWTRFLGLGPLGGPRLVAPHILLSSKWSIHPLRRLIWAKLLSEIQLFAAVHRNTCPSYSTRALIRCQ
jgi:hypothetical protein